MASLVLQRKQKQRQNLFCSLIIQTSGSTDGQQTKLADSQARRPLQLREVGAAARCRASLCMTEGHKEHLLDRQLLIRVCYKHAANLRAEEAAAGDWTPA